MLAASGSRIAATTSHENKWGVLAPGGFVVVLPQIESIGGDTFEIQQNQIRVKISGQVDAFRGSTRGHGINAATVQSRSQYIQ
jgi:hypothetical protein